LRIARGRRAAQPVGRSKVTSSPSTPPGPTRPFTSAEVMALSCQPSLASLLRIFSCCSSASGAALRGTLSRSDRVPSDSFPPIRPSRSWTTRYS
jgi:hypothetical protein